MSSMEVESANTSESQASGQTVRGRGGFRKTELNTKPAGIEKKGSRLSDSKAVELLTNFFKVEPMKEKIINQYRVDFEPNVESVSMRHYLFKDATKDLFSSRVIIDSSVTDVKSSSLLRDKITEKFANNPQDPDNLVTVIIKHTGVVVWGSFEMLSVYNKHMKSFLKQLGFYSIGRAGTYIHPDLAKHITNEIMSVPGYRTSANIHEGDQILMNLEYAHKLVQKQNVLEDLKQVRKNAGEANFTQACRAALIGKLVVTNYNSIVYRVEDVNFDLNPEKTFFDKKQNKEVSFVEYYKTRYNKSIVAPKQPLLLVIPNSKRRGSDANDAQTQNIYLVPELCNLAGLTDQQRENRQLKTQLIQASQIPPKERVQDMMYFLKQLHNNDSVKASLAEWGYQYAEVPLTLTGTCFAQQAICTANTISKPPDQWRLANEDGGFDQLIMRDRLAVAPRIDKLYIVVSSSVRSDLQPIKEKLKSGFDKIGLIVDDAEWLIIDERDSAISYQKKLRSIPNEASAVMIILQNQNKTYYDVIKKHCSIDRGLITQVVTSRLLLDNRKAFGACLKIGVQMAAKLGGEPWYVRIPLSKTIICGYDTYHDTANRGRSFGAFVASMNSKFSRWFSRADSHDRLEELSSHVTDNLIVALKKFREENNIWPEKCIFYRDGVGDGQLEHVFNIEVKQIQKAIASCHPQIKLTFIVVNKRIGARFFSRLNNTLNNPAPGTVIDDVVTRSHRFDFYLISQSTRNGTVTPTYYNVLHHDTQLGPEKIHFLSYKLCYLYYNWTGTVRVPAPCQYAHKLALLCGENLHGVPHQKLDDKLHFL